MAVLKQRLHRKNANGSYDTIHLETSASLVLMDDGTTTLSSKISSMDDSIGNAVKKTGDTLTGSLSIEAASYSDLKLKDTTNGSYATFRNSAHRTQILSHSDGSNYRSLVLHDKTATKELSNILQIQEIVDGAQSASYRVYHTGYETTPDKIGAAAATHTHAAGDITSGTLPVTRGGTGVTTIDALKTALGISSGSLKYVKSTFTSKTSGTVTISCDFYPIIMIAQMYKATASIGASEIGIAIRGCLGFIVYFNSGMNTMDVTWNNTGLKLGDYYTSATWHYIMLGY